MIDNRGFYLYLFKIEGHDLHKVGITRDPHTRRGCIQASCPFTVTFTKVYQLADIWMAESYEHWLHLNLRGAALHGEWYAADSGILTLMAQIPEATDVTDQYSVPAARPKFQYSTCPDRFALEVKLNLCLAAHGDQWAYDKFGRHGRSLRRQIRMDAISDAHRDIILRATPTRSEAMSRRTPTPTPQQISQSRVFTGSQAAAAPAGG